MNIVFVRHVTSKKFAFSVPDELVPYIKKDQGVLCQTMHGLDYGTTITGVISGEGALDLAFADGAYLPLKPIVGIEHPAFAKSKEIRKIIADEVMVKIALALGAKK